MVHSPMRWLVPAVIFAAALAAQAQPAQPTARPDPLDPKANVPALVYESSLARQRRPGDDKPIAWREANDRVTRIGGWRAYAREVQSPEPASVARPAQSPSASELAKPVPQGHADPKLP